jgi:hypothetical protein
LEQPDNGLITGRNMEPFLGYYVNKPPITVNAWSKDWVCGRTGLLGLGVPIPSEAWMSLVSVLCCVRDICVALITRPEESCVWV